MFQVNKNSTSCKFADMEDFDEIQKLYWNLIEKSKDKPRIAARPFQVLCKR